MTSWSHDFTHGKVAVEYWRTYRGSLLYLQTMAAIGLSSMPRFPRTVFVVVKPKPLTAPLKKYGSWIIKKSRSLSCMICLASDVALFEFWRFNCPNLIVLVLDCSRVLRSGLFVIGVSFWALFSSWLYIGHLFEATSWFTVLGLSLMQLAYL